jgi:signal transduction histidine kinase
MLAAYAVWLVTLIGLAAWWGRLLMRQAAHIAELESRLGLPGTSLVAHTSRMMFWESATFFVLLFASGAALAWLTWHEARRARSLQAFFAAVTHELRTPLTSIRLQAESLSDEVGDGPLVGRLLEDTGRLEAQVERTLELARVEGGGPVFSRPLALKSWLDYALRSHRQIQVAAELDAELEIRADPGALQVILKNLLENSRRHAGSAASERAPSVRLTAERRAGWVVLHYRDDGPGFTGDHRRLGRLFYKGHDSPGAGVGLYLVSMLMKRMGGRAEFAGRSGFETELWFRHA